MNFFKCIRISTFGKGIVFLKERGDGMAAEDINIAFGKHLRGIRIQLGMNQDDVAAACGIDPTSISRLERGETNATLTTLQRLSKGLCIPLQDLMDLREVYQVTVVGEELLGEIQSLLGKLSPEEQHFILNFIRSFVSLRNDSND